MLKVIQKILLTCIVLALLMWTSCEPFIPEFPNGIIEGMRPIYVEDSELQVSRQAPLPVSRSGKIYSYGDLLLINEVDEGIHVIDNSDPVNPENLYFLQVPGNTDMAIKDGFIYANNHTDLVVISVEEDSFTEVYRVRDLFLEEIHQQYPPQNDVYFECVDESRGRMIGWATDLIESPQCYKRR